MCLWEKLYRPDSKHANLSHMYMYVDTDMCWSTVLFKGICIHTFNDFVGLHQTTRI